MNIPHHLKQIQEYLYKLKQELRYNILRVPIAPLEQQHTDSKYCDYSYLKTVSIPNLHKIGCTRIFNKIYPSFYKSEHIRYERLAATASKSVCI